MFKKIVIVLLAMGLILPVGVVTAGKGPGGPGAGGGDDLQSHGCFLVKVGGGSGGRRAGGVGALADAGVAAGLVGDLAAGDGFCVVDLEQHRFSLRIRARRPCGEP